MNSYEKFLWSVVWHTFKRRDYREMFSALREILFPGAAEKITRKILGKKE